MTDFEKHIDDIRNFFEKQKAKRYSFENPLLTKKDEYVKSLYFRMLCTLVRYTGEPSKMQVLYIRRLIAGSHAEKEFQDYMKMALVLKKEEMEEFLSVFKEDNLKYYFCIDGLILLAVDRTREKSYELLAGLMELLGIDRKELAYIVAVAKAIITQDSALFDESRAIVTETTKHLSMYYYIQNFYTGAIEDTSERLHIYSREKAEVDIAKYLPIKTKRVIVENVTLSLQTAVIIENCEEVLFLNTDLQVNNSKLIFKNVQKVKFKNARFENGREYPITFEVCGNILIDSCCFSNFTSRVIQEEDVKSFSVSNSLFEQCEYQTDYWEEGGVIYSEHSQKNNYLKKCTFLNCAIRTSCGSQWVCGIISNCDSELDTCTFKGCWPYYKKTKIDTRGCNSLFNCRSKAVNCTRVNSSEII